MQKTTMRGKSYMRATSFAMYNARREQIYLTMLRYILLTFSGIGAFLLGMKLIATNLSDVAGGKIKELFGKIGDKRFSGIGLGIGSSAILQSSSATTVILLGLVNAGIVSLFQATCVIMGANIGTTFTALVFSANNLPIGEVFAFAAFVGAMVVMCAKTDKIRSIGYIIASLGLIFIGLNVIKTGATGLNEFAWFGLLFSYTDNPLFFIVFGVAFTAIIQSSSVTTGIVITLAHLGIMPVTGAFYVIMGSNVGSCATAMLASVGGSVNAKRTALINLLFNMIGVVIFLPLTMLFGQKVVDFFSGYELSVLVAYFHIAFNLVTTLILLPFVNKLSALASRLVKEEGDQSNAKLHRPLRD